MKQKKSIDCKINGPHLKMEFRKNSNKRLGQWTRAFYMGMLFSCLSLCAENKTNEVDEPSREVFIEAKLGGFIPVNSTFRSGFEGAGIYGLELDVEAWGPFFGFLGLSYYHDSGQTISNPSYRTTIDLVQPYIGGKLIAPKDYFFRPYIGGALQGSCAINKTNAPYLIQNKTTWAPGALAVAGIMVARKEFVFDLFCNYSWLVMHMGNSSSQKVVTNNQDISGVSIGAGLGYTF
ncbi:MAG: hypothetical protein ACOYK9_06030 [Chlamydiia bacterium]